ncbi:hypothetical protein [Methylobacterium planeticum]|uniref:Uncharacterized protein n=1 Tax=Methylobacterium planeticum TaxID=2615211 RepID=A0A6N6MK22_9HYPH|nr:hypothetical protein [Methylobacterium planeticum]KAB1069935.1 hypothetical protein F6X51_24145 [Methylobacterium planeticum]
MPLLSLWASNQEAVGQLNVEQVVGTAGDGNLRDGSVCSSEFREYLSQIPTSKIATYVDQCLSASLNRGGMILQDLVNEIGRRLDYGVRNGRYQGVAGEIGYDGIWLSPDGHSVVAEVKTTDAYRISLDTLAGYRNKLIEAGHFAGTSSVLIIVGRQDTGDLEAQIRGSRHAWDVRLISAEALLKLVQLKENSETPETGRKIRSLLAPMEYTRLDGMVDVMFTTTVDVGKAVAIEEDVPDEQPVVDRPAKVHTFEFTDGTLLQQKREGIIAALGRREGAPLIRRSRALYWTADHGVRAVCSISKRYAQRHSYWYAYHPPWDDFLCEEQRAYFLLGCMDLDTAFVLPRDTLAGLLGHLNRTTKEDGSFYWHVHIADRGDGRYAILLPKISDQFLLTDYRLEITGPTE